jgi:signal transduction histidine kinase
MTFTGRLRWALVLAALLPTAIIGIIVVAATSEQVTRIENRDAKEAYGRFVELYQSLSQQVDERLHDIAASREFQVMEWGLWTDKQVDPKYKLPTIFLDFVEYLDSSGTVLVSANRPGLIGQRLPTVNIKIADDQVRHVFENDLEGRHPALISILVTENGYLRGGIYLDRSFAELMSGLVRADMHFISRTGSDTDPPHPAGVPYRYADTLYAVMLYDSLGDYYVSAKFEPYDWQALFNNFLTAVVVVTVLMLLLVIPAGLYFTSRTRRELRSLIDGATRVAAGNMSQPVIVTTAGEFSELADTFNLMMRQLNDYHNRLVISQKIAAWQSIGRKIAHEVKNPLTPISIAIDDLAYSYREKRPDFADVLSQSSASIKSEINRIKRLIDEFSTFAKMPAPEFKETTVSHLFQDITVLFQDDIASKRLVIDDTSDDASAEIDADQIRQVLINLIKNSCETEGTECRVEISSDEKNLIIAVEDNGPGFPDRLITEGPVPYFSTKEGGSGLGLVICQRIVFDHDGALELNNKPDGGARVILTLPKAHAQNITR